MHLKKKISATQYVPLQGIYKPDPKQSFSYLNSRGSHHLVQDFYFVDFHSAYSQSGQVKAE